MRLKEEHNSWGTAPQQCVILPLVAELQAQGRVLPQDQGRLQVTRRDHRKKQPDPVSGERGYLKPRGPHTPHGVENLQGDWHDKIFGLWRTPQGTHHRIDIVVVSQPEELPFALLSWTGPPTLPFALTLAVAGHSTPPAPPPPSLAGTRSLNRLLRLRALELGLNLNANGLTGNPHKDGAEQHRVALPVGVGTKVRIEARPGHEPLEIVVRGYGVVPYRYMRSEEDILRVLAQGTDAFAHLYDPRNRNA